MFYGIQIKQTKASTESSLKGTELTGGETSKLTIEHPSSAATASSEVGFAID